MMESKLRLADSLEEEAAALWRPRAALGPRLVSSRRWGPFGARVLTPTRGMGHWALRRAVLGAEKLEPDAEKGDVDAAMAESDAELAGSDAELAGAACSCGRRAYATWHFQTGERRCSGVSWPPSALTPDTLWGGAETRVGHV